MKKIVTFLAVATVVLLGKSVSAQSPEKFTSVVSHFEMTIPAEPKLQKFDGVVDSTQTLRPGKTYLVDIVQIKSASTEDCLKFLKDNHAILAGSFGISCIYQTQKESLPTGKWLLSFDTDDNTWYFEKTDIYPARDLVPYGLLRSANSDPAVAEFGFRDKDGSNWGEGSCLAVFREK